MNFFRDLAKASLDLFCSALPNMSARFPPLFSLEVFGSVVGIFELNNLSLSVPTPVEDYFLLIDDLPEVGCVASPEFYVWHWCINLAHNS